MDFTSKKKLAKNFVKELNKGQYNTHHKLQRNEGMWKSYQKSLLIDSMLRPYPFDPIRCEKKNTEELFIFDGVQRATTIRDFFGDVFALDKKLNAIQIGDTVYDLAGKKFSELDEELKERLENFELIIYTFTDCTDEDIRNMFFRQNNGKALTNTQKRTAIEPAEVSEIVFNLACNEMFEKFLTDKQLNNDVQKDVIRETLMLINSSDEHDFTYFSAKKIDEFVIWYADNVNNDDVNILDEVMTTISNAFEEKTKLAYTSIPMILYAAYTCKKEGKDFDKFIEALRIFIEEYDVNIDYKSYLAGGTTKSTSVNGRLDYWKAIVADL